MSKVAQEGQFLMFSLAERIGLLTASSCCFNDLITCVMRALPSLHQYPKWGLAGGRSFKARVWRTSLMLAPSDIFVLIPPLPHCASFCFSLYALQIQGGKVEMYCISSTSYTSLSCPSHFRSSRIIIKYHHENKPEWSSSNKHASFTTEL